MKLCLEGFNDKLGTLNILCFGRLLKVYHRYMLALLEIFGVHAWGALVLGQTDQHPLILFGDLYTERFNVCSKQMDYLDIIASLIHISTYLYFVENTYRWNQL